MTRLNVGDILEGRYRIDQPIARGGMSTVYRCVDMRLGRAVAAKVMDERYHDDPVFVTRFEREARAMAQLSHPNLVGVHDFSADGLPIYLIMELITGGTLRELLAERGPMPPHAAAGVMHSVLAGLSEVHAAGLVHRDIKPDNVLITSTHRVKVGDFGLVRSARAEHDSSGHIVGTVSYLSPEQVTGDDIAPASDVYSAGIVLFELLTGTVPFSGDTPLAHATARVHADVPAPSSRIEGVPMLFDALVATATARHPAERFADAGEFLDALDDVSRELQLPTFTVPIPHNSAAARTAAVPTDFAGAGNTRVFEATSAIETPRAETRAEPPAFENPPYETRVEPPLAPPPAASPAVSHTAAPAPSAEPYAPAGAIEEPEERPLSNRSAVSLIGFLILVSLATLAVAVAAWWFGSGEYGTWPILWRPY